MSFSWLKALPVFQTRNCGWFLSIINIVRHNKHYIGFIKRWFTFSYDLLTWQCQKETLKNDQGKLSEEKIFKENQMQLFYKTLSVWITQAECWSQKQSVRQQRPTALQRQGLVWLFGCGLHGLLLPVPWMCISQVRRRVPLWQEVALRADGSGRWRNHPEQVCHLVFRYSFVSLWFHTQVRLMDHARLWCTL